MNVKIGVALYSVRKQMNEDPIATIENLGNLGYKYIEGANYNLDDDPFLGFGIAPKDFKKKMDEFGMELINCHIGRADVYIPGSRTIYKEYPTILDLTDDDIRKCSELHLLAGNKRLCNPIMLFPNDKEGVLRRCEYLQHLSDLAKECGTEFLYHSHFQEFVIIEDKFILDYIVENTDLPLELDVFWVMRSGEDPIEMLKRFGNRIVLVHQKDFSKTTEAPLNLFDKFGDDYKYAKYADKSIKSKEFMTCEEYPDAYVEIGTGIMPIQDIINTVNEFTNAEYVILEQDYSINVGDELLSVKISLENFRKMTGVHWA